MQTGPQPTGTSFPPRLAAVAWLALPLACHLGFSWIGFNPTDDGWLQAVARRMLDGEFPHRDFIFVRPALSAILQIPLVWLGGEYTIWLSRLWGWLTIGGLAWIWSGLARPRGAPPLLRPLLYAAAFLLTAHVFPVMAWHSLDALLLASLAVWFAARGALRTAFVCAGLAALCRQNFALFTPLLLLALPGPRKWRAVWWAALPPAAYLAAMLCAGALQDFLEQTASTGGRFAGAAFGRYGRSPGFLWAVPGGALAALALHQVSRWRPAGGGALALAIVAAFSATAALRLWLGLVPFHDFAFLLLGFVAGLVATAALFGRGLPDEDRLLFIAGLGLAWVTAISLGYQSPALAAGLLLVLLWRAVFSLPGMTAPGANASLATALAGLLALGAAFWHARLAHPYRDRAAADLRFDVGPVLRGGAGLRTNELTHSMLAKLRQLTDRCESEGRPYVILTDNAAAWIRSPQRNLLPCEWPQETELGYSPQLVRRFLESLNRLPPGTHIIVQSCLISEMSQGLYAVPPDWTHYFVQNWVGRHYRKLETTGFFDIYAPPGPG